MLDEFSVVCVHLSLGLSVLIVVTASEFSGVCTVIALPITALSITISALCGSVGTTVEAPFKKRKFGDLLAFLYIWLEILEILTAAATCARISSATIDYISRGRLRELLLGIESHSLGEPWPDIIGVSVIIVITTLFMLGLERSQSLSVLLLLIIIATFTFFLSLGGIHTVISPVQWIEDIKNCSVQSILTAATLCSYGFISTFPKISNHKTFKLIIMVLVPLILYLSVVLVFTLMSHYKELQGTATPLLRVFELRDVDWARLVMAIFIISIVCLALTEILPSLYYLFIKLASKEWQIFLASLQYRNSFTGAPILAIFAAGSLAAILAFACPMAYLLKILNTSTLLKCIFKGFQTMYYQYRPEFNNDSYLVNSPVTQYSKLKQSTRTPKEEESKMSTLMSCLKKKVPSNGINSKRNRNLETESGLDDEYLLLNDYCDRTIQLQLNEDSSDESEIGKESVQTSDAEDSCSSTDIDAVVQEYRDKVQIATVDNFSKNKHPTHVTAATVTIFLFIVIISVICLSQAIIWRLFNLLWPSLIATTLSTIVILLMPKNADCVSEFLPNSIIAICTMLSIEINIVLISMIIKQVWPGFIFWLCAGSLLFWRCDCCTCDGLVNPKNRFTITENISQYSDKYVDTILIAR